MSESCWNLINFDQEIGSTYIMDVPGGALYMVKPGRVVERVAMKYGGADFVKDPVAVKEWEDLPPRLAFVPGASVAIEVAKAEERRQAMERVKAFKRAAMQALTAAITKSGGKVHSEGESCVVASVGSLLKKTEDWAISESGAPRSFSIGEHTFKASTLPGNPYCAFELVSS